MEHWHSEYVPCEDIELFASGRLHRSWLSFGCHYIKELGEHRFLLWAPGAVSVGLVGDFNGWDRAATPMERVYGGCWVCFVKGLEDGALYKYCVTGADGVQRMKADPFAARGQFGAETASVVWTGEDYSWSDKSYMRRRAKADIYGRAMSIYEVHPGSWKKLPDDRPGYRALGDMLAEYCTEMGFTHVELMPVCEYPYDGSWGYQVCGYYAPTSRYGSPEDLKYLVDKLHSAGIGVIIDWVPAHFPKDEHGLGRFDGTNLFERKEQRMAEHPEWGTLIFDYASPQVRSFLISSACKLIEEFHVDGIRVDAVSSMLYLDYGRGNDYTPNREGGNIDLDAVVFLRELNSAVQSYPGAITIAEESTAYPKVSAPAAEGGLGFNFKWDMGYMHDTLDYMAMDPIYRSYHHGKITFSMVYAFAENFVLAYSHDEVVHCKNSMLNKMFGDYELKFASLKTLYAMQFAHPGRKLCFMGSEFGQLREWDYQGELDWALLDDPRHEGLRQFYKELNGLYRSKPALYTIENSWDGFRWLNVDDNEHSSVAFMRMAGEGSSVICACNFTPVPCKDFSIALPEEGRLRLLMSSDEPRFGGKGAKVKKRITSVEERFLDMQYSARLDLPPMSALFYSFTPTSLTAREDKT